MVETSWNFMLMVSTGKSLWEINIFNFKNTPKNQ